MLCRRNFFSPRSKFKRSLLWYFKYIWRKRQISEKLIRKRAKKFNVKIHFFYWVVSNFDFPPNRFVLFGCILIKEGCVCIVKLYLSKIILINFMPCFSFLLLLFIQKMMMEIGECCCWRNGARCMKNSSKSNSSVSVARKLCKINEIKKRKC